MALIGESIVLEPIIAIFSSLVNSFKTVYVPEEGKYSDS
jgi:hypothetical protein